MKKTLIVLLVLIGIKSYSQSIDEIVTNISDSIASHKTDSLAHSLDSTISYTVFTKDNTPTKVAKLFAPKNSAYLYTITLLCMNTANGDMCTSIHQIIIRNVSDKVGVVKSIATLNFSCSATTSTAKYVIATDGTITITGVANLIMKWVINTKEINHVSVP